MERLSALLSKSMPGIEWIWRRIEVLPIGAEHRIFVAIYLVPCCWFYLYGFALFLLDMLATEKFRQEYKVQNDVHITVRQYWDALVVSVFNWLLALPYLATLAYYVTPSLQPSLPPIPTTGIFLRDMMMFILVEEALFYASHRLLHHSYFYKTIHKFHHTFTAPFGIAAIYAHPIEHMVSNVIPVSIGSLLMCSHPVTSLIWGILALFNTMTVHSGYDLSTLLFLFPAPYFHDWHHEKFSENFGAIQLLDYAFGTNVQFLKAIETGEMYAPRNKKL